MSKIIGRYIPGDSIVYKMDPRGKIIATFLFIVIIFLANNWLSYFFLSIFTLLAVWATKLKPKVFWDGVKPLIWLILFSFCNDYSDFDSSYADDHIIRNCRWNGMDLKTSWLPKSSSSSNCSCNVYCASLCADIIRSSSTNYECSESTWSRF